jgi:ABC-type Fe3+ transport system, permease component
MSLLTRIDEVSGKRRFKKAWFALVCLLFLSLIILPSIYVLFEAVGQWDAIKMVMDDGVRSSQIYGAVWNSFSIAFIVTIIDIIVGLPMAWLMVRKDFPGKKYLDTLIDMPLAFPTAALGFSVAILWAAPAGVAVPGLGLVLSPYLLVILLHLIFTFPYMVRCLSGILEQIDQNCETAGMTLGASRFTAVRTITLPLFRAGLITGFILCFARSLSETGGTLIALQLIGAEHSFFTGPTFLGVIKLDPTVADPTPYLIFISVILIILAILFLVIAKYLMSRLKIPWSKVWPKWERKISRGLAVRAKDIFTFVFLFIIIIIPSFYIFSYLFTPAETLDYGALMTSIGISFMIAGAAVAFSVVFGIPMAIYIARNGNTKLGKILDNLINIPLIIPTTALGFSLALFWGGMHMSSWGFLLVIFGHIAFTYPLLVRNIIGAIEEVDPAYEEISRTLGAKPLQAFRKVLLPIIQSSVIGGCILAFTRSLGETGATIAIDKTVTTVPVLIYNFMNNNEYYSAALSSIVLILICFVMMFLVRFVTKKKGAA